MIMILPMSKPVCRLSFVIVLLFFKSVSLEIISALSQEVPVYSSQENRDIHRSKTLKQYPHTIHFPQVNHQPTETSSSQRILPHWYSTTPQTSSNLREPANFPTVIYQDDAHYLERYMKNNFEDGENSSDGKLNLASLNHRVPKSDVQSTLNQQPQRRFDSGASNLQGLPNDNNPMLKNSHANLKKPDPIKHQSGNGLAFKMGRVDDVTIFKPNLGTEFYPPSPARQLIGPKVAHLDKYTKNCLTQSEPYTSRCEDHLIRRLNQDATEGRTVLDVGRRVCCALFWHKDCIDGIVLQRCPDSSTAAANYLIGSRKLDLTLSCQRFTRDGCNGAPSKLSISNLIISLSFYFVLTYICSIWTLIYGYTVDGSIDVHVFSHGWCLSTLSFVFI